MPTLQVQPDFAFDASTDASDVASARIGACRRRIRCMLRDKHETRKLVRRRRREISLLPGPFRASDLICGTYIATVSGQSSLRA
jgi:hypothetical protein